MDLICTPCGDKIGPATKYLVVYQTPTGFLVHVGCEHIDPLSLPDMPMLAILGSMDCAQQWFASFCQSLKCQHVPEARV